MITDIQGTVSNLNPTVHNVGSAAGVEACTTTELPPWSRSLNAGITTFDRQAAEMNRNLNEGGDTLNQQAGELNRNLSAGVDHLNVQAGELNQHLNDGIDTLNHQKLNEGVISLNQQAFVSNANAADGIHALNSQAGQLNWTVDQNTSDINGAISTIMPSLKTCLDILGPLHCIMGSPYFALALTALGALQATAVQAQLLKEVRVTNAILRGMADGYREVELPGIVQNITGASMVFDQSTNTMEAYFFYSMNNSAIHQLRGLKYFAYNTVSELFDKVHIWNAFADAATRTQESSHVSRLVKRRTKIYFLDPCPSSSHVLSHLEFTELYQSITIVNHYAARQNVILESVKVHKGCSFELEHATVYKIDATRGGIATLRKCNVSWDQSSQSPVPFLFGGAPSEFNNPYNVCGTVFCHECTTQRDSKKNKRPSNKFVSCRGNANNVKQDTSTKVTIEHTIANISDAVWNVEFEPGFDGVGRDSLIAGFVAQDSASDSEIPEQLDAHAAILPFGGSVTFRVTCGLGVFVRSISGAIIFTDRQGAEYRHTFRGRSNLTDYTIASPTISGGPSSDCTTASPSDVQTHSMKSIDSPTASQHNTILVVGRFGSGKSTFLNTLAGSYWKVDYDQIGTPNFVANHGAVEMFPTSKSVKGCTVAAVARNITTFDGRDMTVIDTVGYDDTANDSSFYDTSNLTEVMDQYKEISAVVIVVNSQDPRLTRGFVESLACVPTSFKTKVQKNVILVFSKWTEDDEELYGEQPDRGLTEQVNIIRAVLGANEDDEIKAFFMDNRAFRTYARAQRTIETMTSFLDHIDTMPRLSCPEFKEMRAISQFERVVRKDIRQYFQPSDGSSMKRSGFEKFLLVRARKDAENIPKLSLTGSTAKSWSDKLVKALLQDINNELPKDIQRICDEAAIQLNLKSIPRLNGSNLTPEMMQGYLASGLINGGIIACVATAPISFGASLLAIPACFALDYLQSKSWSREVVIDRVVLSFSNEYGAELCSQITGQFSSFVDSKVEEIQTFFDSL